MPGGIRSDEGDLLAFDEDHAFKQSALKFTAKDAEVVVGLLHRGRVDLEENVEVLLGCAHHVGRITRPNPVRWGELIVQHGDSAEVADQRSFNGANVVVRRDLNTTLRGG